MNEDVARYLFEGIFNIYPKFKLASLKLLLENKQLQNITIASIIALLYAFEEKNDKLKRWRVNKIELVEKELKVKEKVELCPEDVGQIRVQILHTVLEHLKIPLYKDEEFLG